MLRQLSLRQKMFLLLSLPLLIIAVLISQTIGQLNQRVAQAQHTQQLVEAITLLDQTAHNLALERGLTAGFIGSKGEQGKQQLSNQRLVVDEQFGHLSNFAKENPSLTIYVSLANQITDKQPSLVTMRSKVDTLAPDADAFGMISTLNAQVLAAVATLMVEVPDESAKRTLLAIYELLNVKELAGQERGKLNFIFSQGQGTPISFAQVRGYIDEQTLHQQTFTAVAPEQLSSTLDESMNSPELAEFYEFRASFLRQSSQRNRIIGIEAPHWFSLATERIKAVKSMADLIRSDLVASTLANTASQKKEFYITLSTIALAIILIIGFAFWLLHDITNRVESINVALHRFANKGDLRYRLNDLSKDEIGSIARHYDEALAKIGSVISSVANVGAGLSEKSIELHQLVKSNNQLVKQQKNETTQIAASMTQMASSIQEVASSAEGVQASMESASLKSQAGRSQVNKTHTAVIALQTEMTTASKEVDTLVQHSLAVEKILEDIRAIAEQTNLLALNAAIEAARAGEHGRGFAVVADEVRMLSMRSRDSTEEIQSLIDNIRAASERAQASVENSDTYGANCIELSAASNQDIDSITDAVNTSASHTEQIAVAVEEQAAVANEIDQNASQLNALAEQNASDVSQLRQNGEQLAHMADELNQLMTQFKQSG